MRSSNAKFPAVYIDRDGTINVEAGYISHPDNFVLYPFAAQAIRLFNLKHFYVFVVTNQAGLAKGYFDLKTLNNIHKKMISLINTSGALINKIYICPHDKNGTVKKYRKDCNCKKPREGMILKSFEEYSDIDRENIYIIGDKYSDIAISRYINFKKTILVKTGYGLATLNNLEKKDIKPTIVSENLLFAALEILK